MADRAEQRQPQRVCDRLGGEGAPGSATDEQLGMREFLLLCHHPRSRHTADVRGHQEDRLGLAQPGESSTITSVHDDQVLAPAQAPQDGVERGPGGS